MLWLALGTKTLLVILRKTSRIGLKYQFWRLEILLEISEVSKALRLM